jgi:hypothetical protein
MSSSIFINYSFFRWSCHGYAPFLFNCSHLARAGHPAAIQLSSSFRLHWIVPLNLNGIGNIPFLFLCLTTDSPHPNIAATCKMLNNSASGGIVDLSTGFSIPDTIFGIVSICSFKRFSCCIDKGFSNGNRLRYKLPSNPYSSAILAIISTLACFRTFFFSRLKISFSTRSDLICLSFSKLAYFNILGLCLSGWFRMLSAFSISSCFISLKLGSGITSQGSKSENPS